MYFITLVSGGSKIYPARNYIVTRTFRPYCCWICPSYLFFMMKRRMLCHRLLCHSEEIVLSLSIEAEVTVMLRTYISTLYEVKAKVPRNQAISIAYLVWVEVPLSLSFSCTASHQGGWIADISNSRTKHSRRPSSAVTITVSYLYLDQQREQKNRDASWRCSDAKFGMVLSCFKYLVN